MFAWAEAIILLSSLTCHFCHAQCEHMSVLSSSSVLMFLRWLQGEVRPQREVGTKGNAGRCVWGALARLTDSFLGNPE